MKNFKGLKIVTKEARNYFFWSLLGIVLFTAWFSVKYLDSTPLNFGQALTSLSLECVTIGVFGVMLTLVSCGRYYLRLGIVPGLYHSTICIPVWDSSNITFSVSSGLYFSLISGVLFTVSYCSITYALFKLQSSYIFPFQIQTYASGILTTYNYLNNDSKLKELIGVFTTIVFSNGIFLDNPLEFSVQYIGIGGVLALINLVCVVVLANGKKCIDSNSIAVLTCFVIGLFGAGLMAVDFWIGNGEYEYLSVGKGVVFAAFLYCFCKCPVGEVNLLLVYPCLCTVFYEFESVGRLITLFGAIGGVVLAVFGDLPLVVYQKCRTVPMKSPLNSPLLI